MAEKQAFIAFNSTIADQGSAHKRRSLPPSSQATPATTREAAPERNAQTPLQEQPPEQISQPEEHEDHDRDDGRDQAHHLQQL
jgi:hypothetical protein